MIRVKKIRGKKTNIDGLSSIIIERKMQRRMNVSSVSSLRMTLQTCRCLEEQEGGGGLQTQSQEETWPVPKYQMPNDRRNAGDRRYPLHVCLRVSHQASD